MCTVLNIRFTYLMLCHIFVLCTSLHAQSAMNDDYAGRYNTDFLIYSSMQIIDIDGKYILLFIACCICYMYFSS